MRKVAEENNKTLKAWCVHCGQKQDMTEPAKIIFDTSRGKKARMAGKCSICGTKVSLLVKV